MSISKSIHEIAELARDDEVTVTPEAVEAYLEWVSSVLRGTPWPMTADQVADRILTDEESWQGFLRAIGTAAEKGARK